MSAIGKRKADEIDVPRNETSKPIFVRDAEGELVRVAPGDPLPANAKAATSDAVSVVADAAAQAEAARLAARSEEEIQYDAYLNGKDAKRGNVWIQGAGVASADRAALADSISAQVAEERGEGKTYAMARAYSRDSKVKRSGASSSGGSYGGALTVESARTGATAAAEALARAREASDDDDDEDSLSMTASQLVTKLASVYNLPVSNLPQLDSYGNDLRVPLLERKLRKFLDCFGEESTVSTVDGKPVLKDFEAIRKRYGTVFRESGATLSVGVLKRIIYEPQPARNGDGGSGDDNDDNDDDGGCGWDDSSSYCLAFERHTSLVTPKPGLPLDGSLGVTPPRTQDLAVLYCATGGEMTGMWIAPDKDGLGADTNATWELMGATDLVKSFGRLVARLSGGRLTKGRMELDG